MDKKSELVLFSTIFLLSACSPLATSPSEPNGNSVEPTFTGESMPIPDAEQTDAYAIATSGGGFLAEESPDPSDNTVLIQFRDCIEPISPNGLCGDDTDLPIMNMRHTLIYGSTNPDDGSIVQVVDNAQSDIKGNSSVEFNPNFRSMYFNSVPANVDIQFLDGTTGMYCMPEPPVINVNIPTDFIWKPCNNNFQNASLNTNS